MSSTDAPEEDVLMYVLDNGGNLFEYRKKVQEAGGDVSVVDEAIKKLGL